MIIHCCHNRLLLKIKDRGAINSLCLLQRFQFKAAVIKILKNLAEFFKGKLVYQFIALVMFYALIKCRIRLFVMPDGFVESLWNHFLN